METPVKALSLNATNSISVNQKYESANNADIELNLLLSENDVKESSSRTSSTQVSTNPGQEQDISFNPVDVSNIMGLFNASRDSFNWQAHGLPEFGLGMNESQRQYLYYRTNWLEVSAKDQTKPVNVSDIAAQLENPNSKLSRYFKGSLKAEGKPASDSDSKNMAKALRALIGKGYGGNNIQAIYNLAGQTGTGLLESSDLSFSIKDITFPGADKSKEAEMNKTRKDFYKYIEKYLDSYHPLGQIIGYLDQTINQAIRNGPQKGYLPSEGRIIEYYPQKGRFSGQVAIYSDDRKRPRDFWDQVDKYFDTMIELAGKPKGY